MSKFLKEQIVSELSKRYEGLESCLFLDFQGAGAEDIGVLRGRLRAKASRLTVVKNSLLRKAFEKVGVPDVLQMLDGPTGVVSGEFDPVQLCGELIKWQKETKKTRLKGGILEGEFISAAVIEELSKIPPRDVMLAKLAGLFNLTVVSFGSIVHNTLLRFALLLRAHTEKS